MNAQIPWRRNPQLGLHPGINFSCLRVGGDLGGFIFAAGSVAALVAGLPAARWFFLGALAGGLLLSGVLIAWHDRHPNPPRSWRPLRLDLAGHGPNGGFVQGERAGRHCQAEVG
jgi:hypothetical protein